MSHDSSAAYSPPIVGSPSPVLSPSPLGISTHGDNDESRPVVSSSSVTPSVSATSHAPSASPGAVPSEPRTGFSASAPTCPASADSPDITPTSRAATGVETTRQNAESPRLRSSRSSTTAQSSPTAQDQTLSSSTLGAAAEGDLPFKDVVESQHGGTRDFGFLPIPKRLRWDPDDPPEFTFLLNMLFGVAATWTVASLYYPQPILIQLSRNFDTSYESVTNIPTLLQASYALGLVFITPLGDLVRRRPLLLLLVALSSLLSLILALVPSLAAFEAISFFLGAVSVTPQVLIPLAGDLARPEKRASALSIVLAGLLLGILFARFFSGLITEFASVSVVYYTSFGLQIAIWFMLYASVPDYPAKNGKDLTYFKILWTMAKYAVTEPVLIQSCIIGMCASATFSAFWTTSTFLLGNLYGYNTFQIGLFALIGVIGVLCAPFTGRLIDRLLPWVGVLIGLWVLLVGQAIFTASAGISIAAMVVIIVLLDLGQQVQQVGNATRIFGLDAAGRSRRNAVYIFSLFIGQLIGTAAGTRVYLNHGGYRASGTLCIALLAFAVGVLVMRGPNLPANKWVGWDGGWEMRKDRSEEKKKAKEVEMRDRKGAKLEKEEV